MRIEHLQPQQSDSWQAFVDATPGAGALHHAAWLSILRNCFAVTPYFLQAVDVGGRLQGILPLYHSRSLFLGDHLATLDGGALCALPQAADALFQEALALRDSIGARYLVARGGVYPSIAYGAAQEVVFTRIPVDQSASAIWDALNKKTRWGVRVAEKAGLSVRRNDDAVQGFYAVYAANLRNLGTPVIGACMFHEMRRHLGKRFQLYVVEKDGAVVGGMICVTAGDTWFDLYAAVLEPFKRIYGNYLLYWTVTRRACEAAEVRIFNLGRSAIGSGNHAFKQKWRGIDERVAYRYYHAPGIVATIPGQELRAGMTVKQRVWSSLPLPVATCLGPFLRRQLPFS